MLEEKHVVSLVLEGNQAAFKSLVKQYERMVFYIVYKLTDNSDIAKDIAQEVFIKVYRNISKFKFESKLSTWIGKITYSETVNYLKKENRYTTADRLDDIHATTLKSDDSPFDNTDKNDISFHLKNAIARLPEHYRRVLVLYHLDEFDYKEIGDICQMPEGTVKNYIFRARKLLKEDLELNFKEEWV